MKKYFYLMLCAGLLMGAPQAQAHNVSKMGKIVSKFVKKVKPKNTVKPKSKFKSSSTRVLFVECEACKGKGKMEVWNYDYRCFQTQTCPHCNGIGEVKKAVIKK